MVVQYLQDQQIEKSRTGFAKGHELSPVHVINKVRDDPKA